VGKTLTELASVGPFRGFRSSSYPWDIVGAQHRGRGGISRWPTMDEAAGREMASPDASRASDVFAPPTVIIGTSGQVQAFIDFGIGRGQGTAPIEDEAGMRPGKASYMFLPNRRRGSRLDGRSDIFQAWALFLYEITVWSSGWWRGFKGELIRRIRRKRKGPRGPPTCATDYPQRSLKMIVMRAAGKEAGGPLPVGPRICGRLAVLLAGFRVPGMRSHHQLAR